MDKIRGIWGWRLRRDRLWEKRKASDRLRPRRNQEGRMNIGERIKKFGDIILGLA